MDKTDTINVAFLAGVVIVLVAAFIYVNFFWEEDEEEEEDEGGEETESFVDVAEYDSATTGDVPQSYIGASSYQVACC